MNKENKKLKEQRDSWEAKANSLNYLIEENKLFLSKIDELDKETTQRGLMIGKKDEEIKQLKEKLKIHGVAKSIIEKEMEKKD